MRTLILVLMLVPLLGFTACQRRPNVPEQVTVVVERYKPLPAWSTDPLPKPQPVDGTVEARVRSDNARGEVIDLANCHRRLLAKLDRGESVDRKACQP